MWVIIHITSNRASGRLVRRLILFYCIHILLLTVDKCRYAPRQRDVGRHIYLLVIIIIVIIIVSNPKLPSRIAFRCKSVNEGWPLKSPSPSAAADSISEREWTGYMLLNQNFYTSALQYITIYYYIVQLIMFYQKHTDCAYLLILSLGIWKIDFFRSNSINTILSYIIYVNYFNLCNLLR